MWKDEIIEEIYRIREEHAKAFNYDLQAICDDLRQKQAVSNRQIISQPLKQPSRQNNKCECQNNKCERQNNKCERRNNKCECQNSK
ncbi:hypothetical protein ACEYW6_29665 [Nostoc sp. UIC 10607]